MLRRGELLQLWQVVADYDLHLKTARPTTLCVLHPYKPWSALLDLPPHLHMLSSTYVGPASSM